jgi:hypothetical protein
MVNVNDIFISLEMVLTVGCDPRIDKRLRLKKFSLSHSHPRCTRVQKPKTTTIRKPNESGMALLFFNARTL